MKLGIIGLPNVGKSTLFNALTSAKVEAENYPFCTIEPNIGMVVVPDERLYPLADLTKSKMVTPALIEFFDVAGLVKGASRGEGLGNKFLSHIRSVQAIIHVVKCFKNKNVIQVGDIINPIEDIEIVNLELMLSDLEIIHNRLEKIKKLTKGNKCYNKEIELLQLINDLIEKGKPLRTLDLPDEDLRLIKDLGLLSLKPALYACNVSEDDLIDYNSNEYVRLVKEYASKENSSTIVISAKIESEISQLDLDERDMFLTELGLNEPGLNRLIKTGYDLLGLISFFTSNANETRAWTIKKGTRAQEAAGKIHTDMERGFIRAEVISFENLMNCGSTIKAKEEGLMRLEGKGYRVQDGDVILFRFNV